jgi:hypothetical protein
LNTWTKTAGTSNSSVNQTSSTLILQLKL